MRQLSQQNQFSWLNKLFCVEKKITIGSSPPLIWSIISNPNSYDQWCDFKLSGGLIFQDSQIYLRSREISDEAPSTRLKVTKFTEHQYIEFRHHAMNCHVFVSFELNQLDEQETEFVYSKVSGVAASILILILIFMWIMFIQWVLWTNGSNVPIFVYVFNFLMFVLVFVVVLSRITTERSKMEGSLVNLKHMIDSSNMSTASPVSSSSFIPSVASAPTMAEYVRISSVQPLEIHNPVAEGTPVHSKV